MYKTWKADQLVCVTLSRNETKSRGKDFVCYEHNHTLGYLDTIKVNSKLKNTVAKEVAKGYCPSDISRNIKGVKWAANKEALEDAGGVLLKQNALLVHFQVLKELVISEQHCRPAR